MEEHRRVINECVQKVSSARNSKVISKVKYDQIVSVLTGNSSDDVNAKFRWWVKEKNFQLLNIPELGLTDVLCTPAKKENENDTTILGKWRVQTNSANIADILTRLHWTSQNHVGYKKLLSQVQCQYEGIPRSVIEEVGRTCSVCLMSVKQTNNAELKPILSSGFLTRAQIDLIDMRHKPDGEYSYIAHFVDHWSKYHVIWPLKRKTADEVANGLNERVFPYIGLPRILHSDNGREFVNKVIRELVKDWGGDDVMFVNGRPRHSQSQGLVEQGNATIERHIANKRATLGLTGTDYPWASWLPKIQYNMNTEVAGGIKKTPYEVVFGQPPRTTIIPGARVDNGVINEEDLNFELNPATEGDNEAAEEDVQRPDTTHTGDTLSADRRPETLHTDDKLSTETSEDERTHSLSPVEKPTPKPRRIDQPVTEQQPETATHDEGVARDAKRDKEIPSTERPTPRPRRKKLFPEPLIQVPETTQPPTVPDSIEKTSPIPMSTELPDTCTASTSATSDSSTTEADHEAIAANIPSQSDESRPGNDAEDHIDELFHQDPKSKHYLVRQEADANYRANAEKMKVKYSKRKRVTNVEFREGDFVTVRIPKIDRSSTDQPRLMAKVVECKGNSEKMYKLQCRHGFIEGWYRTGDLMPYGQNSDVHMGEAVISLREASRLENPNKVERKKCRCQGPCGKNCFCVKNNLKCSSHCHPSKTCRNVESKPFVKPTLEDRKIVGDGKELTDKHMYAEQHLLKKRFPHNHGFRDTLMLQTTRTPEETPYIQIMHVNNNHWITIAANNPAGPVEVYDSLNAKRLSEDTLKSINRYHGSSCTVQLMNMQQQKGSTDCGLFAIATATSLCFGDDPTMILYTQDDLRQHLLDCLTAEDISPFPHEATQLKRRRRCRSTLVC